MKLKLKQKIAIQLYKTKFKAISLISNKKAAESLFKLFCTPYSGKPKREVPPFFKKTTKLEIVFEKLIVRGWQWIPPNCNGNKVLVIHGFDSCSYKSEAIIDKLYASGYQVLAFDAPGHGISDGKTVNAKQFSECINDINKKFGELYAIVSHSFGGMAAALATENYLPQLQRLVLIAPATETRSAIDNFFLFLKMPLNLKPEFDNIIKTLSGKDVSYFSVARALENITTKTLWIHDKKDVICPISDVLPVQEKNLPNVTFHITRGLGHNAIYRNQNVLQIMNDFLL
jgi:pimeloyl-ACP methyl ester carboxylesterase